MWHHTAVVSVLQLLVWQHAVQVLVAAAAVLLLLAKGCCPWLLCVLKRAVLTCE
jgi:hypothetical protein